MNLLYTLTTYPPFIGGAQLHQHLLARHLQANHPVQVISFWDHHRTDWLLGTTLKAHSQNHDYVVDRIPVHRMGFSWVEKLAMLPWVLLYYPLMSVALPQVSATIAPHLSPLATNADLVHNVRIGREGLTHASQQIARKHDIPFILTPVHHPRWRGWRYHEYDKLYRSADAVIALTPSEQQILTAIGVAPENIYLTGHGPILAATAAAKTFRQQHDIEGPMVLFLGQHHPYKGFQHLLAATDRVWQRCPETQFVFIGPTVKGSDRAFMEFTDPRIHRLGTVSLQKKTDALAACDVLCVPSTQESFGGVYTEAWSFGKPVIGCNISAVADVVSDRVDGFLVTQDATAIAHRLIDVLTQPALAAQMGQAGQAKVDQRYSWPQLARKTEQIYKTVCGSA